MPDHITSASEFTLLPIGEEYIELYKILKRENLAASGGEAKYLISEGLVTVNGKIETRKRRKTRPNDRVEYNKTTIVVVEKK